MYLSYKKKIFFYFFLVFLVFTTIIVLVQRNREKVYKTENLRTNLNTYTQLISHYIRQNPLQADTGLNSVGNLLPLLPDSLRITIMD